jgi:hypothetical protein
VNGKCQFRVGCGKINLTRMDSLQSTGGGRLTAYHGILHPDPNCKGGLQDYSQIMGILLRMNSSWNQFLDPLDD